MADNVTSLLTFARSGAGMVLLPSWLVQEDISADSLTQLLPNHSLPKQGIYAIYPNTRHVSEKVQTFIEILQEYIDKSHLGA